MPINFVTGEGGISSPGGGGGTLVVLAGIRVLDTCIPVHIDILFRWHLVVENYFVYGDRVADDIFQLSNL